MKCQTMRTHRGEEIRCGARQRIIRGGRKNTKRIRRRNEGSIRQAKVIKEIYTVKHRKILRRWRRKRQCGIRRTWKRRIKIIKVDEIRMFIKTEINFTWRIRILTNISCALSNTCIPQGVINYSWLLLCVCVKDPARKPSCGLVT